MTIIPLTTRSLTRTDREAISLLRRACGKTPFAYLGGGAALLLTPGRTELCDLLQEARLLIQANLGSDRPGVFVHAVKGTDRRMVRTVRDLCVLESAPGSSWAGLLRQGLAACRRGELLAAVLPDNEAALPVAQAA